MITVLDPVVHEGTPQAAVGGRRFVVVAPHPTDEVCAARRLRDLLGDGPIAAGEIAVDVLRLTRVPAARVVDPDRGAPPSPGRVVLPDVEALLDDLDLGVPGDLDAGDFDTDDRDTDDGDTDDGDTDDGEDEDGAAAEAQADATALAAFHGAGLPAARRVRLGLERDTVSAHEADVVGAISEIVGFAEPEGLCVLAPVPAGGGDDHAVAGRAAELVARAYGVDFVIATDPTGSRERACGSGTR